MTSSPVIERFTLPDTSVADLFAGWEAHAFDLPVSVIEAGAGAREMIARREAARSSRDTARALTGKAGKLAAGRASEALVSAALAGRTVESASESIRGSLADLEGAEADWKAARAAADWGIGHVESLVGFAGDEIVVAYLRPAHDAALAGVREVLPALAGVDLADTASVAKAGPAAGPAFLVVVTASERIAALERARECIFYRQQAGGPWRDPYAETRRRGTLRDTTRWPEPVVQQSARDARVTTGPEHPLVRVAWLADPASGAWCPTASEWQAAFDTWFQSAERNGRTRRSPAA